MCVNQTHGVSLSCMKCEMQLCDVRREWKTETGGPVSAHDAWMSRRFVRRSTDQRCEATEQSGRLKRRGVSGRHARSKCDIHVSISQSERSHESRSRGDEAKLTMENKIGRASC